MTPPTFWMVLGRDVPNYRHTSKLSAAKEAERLAKLNPGYQFHVLQSLATVVSGSVAWDPHEESTEFGDGVDKVPF